MSKDIKLYICESCGEKFTALNENEPPSPEPYVPRCPHCGSRHTRPSCFMGLNRWLYSMIWRANEP